MSEKSRNAWIKDKSVEHGLLDDEHEYWIVPHPMFDRGIGFLEVGYNGYVSFKSKPVKEPDYHGILTYVPVHGGITYAEHDELGSAYGFDTGHCDSGKFPIRDLSWIKGQCEIMLNGIRLAATLEDEYLLAEGDNEKRAEICQRILDLQPEQMKNFGVMINLLGGKL
jgi:hypothetical protein